MKNILEIAFAIYISGVALFLNEVKYVKTDSIKEDLKLLVAVFVWPIMVVLSFLKGDC